MNPDEDDSSTPIEETPAPQQEQGSATSTLEQRAEQRVEQRVERRLRAEFQGFTFSGPLPPPDLLMGYNKIFPGCAERIVAMAESVSNHRQELEQAVVKANIESERRGQERAFWLSVLVIVIGGLLIWNDKSVSGLGLIIGDLVALAGVFVYGRYQARKEREEQREKLSPARNSAPASTRVSPAHR